MPLGKHLAKNSHSHNRGSYVIWVPVSTPSNLKRIKTNKHLLEPISASTMSCYKEVMKQHRVRHAQLTGNTHVFIHSVHGNGSSTPPDRLGSCVPQWDGD